MRTVFYVKGNNVTTNYGEVANDTIKQVKLVPVNEPLGCKGKFKPIRKADENFKYAPSLFEQILDVELERWKDKPMSIDELRAYNKAHAHKDTVQIGI